MSHRLVNAARGALVATMLLLPQAPAAASISGAYLAALQADMRNDYDAALRYYGRAIESDPENVDLLQNAAVAAVGVGDIAGARQLADRLAPLVPGSPIAVLVTLADALAKSDFATAATELAQSGPEANPLLTGLVNAWIAAGEDDFTEAQARFDAMGPNDALGAFGQYHKALALALAGDFVAAETILAGGEEGPLHLSQAALIAHAQILAQIDRTDEAIALVDEAIAAGFPEATLVDLRDRLAAGEEVPFTQVTKASDGAAEAFLMLAEGLNTPENDRLALIYARLARHIRPDLVEADLIAAEALARQGQYALAIAALDAVPADSPWSIMAGIKRANTQRDAGDADGAITTLAGLVDANPDSLDVRAAYADNLRIAERFAEAADAYTGAIDLLGEPQPQHWPLFYSRAIAFERSDQWDRAEADFRKALELSPGQPSVQNYLGYSLVEQRRNLDEALALIEAAVAGQPDDGYITDSLGWVLYRLERYEEAVPHMLRAVELEPVDPVINDHLGDVLWKVGRQREAEFQWRRALSFGPAPDLDMDRIRRKLEVGLDAVYTEEAEKDG